MFWKKSGVIVLLCAFLLLFTACSKDETASGGSTDKKQSATLTVWIHPYVSDELKSKQNEVFKEMGERFKKEYPNVKVKFEEIPWANREQKILTALAAKQGPDVFYLIPDMMAQFADKGVLAPIDDLLGDYGKDDFDKTSLEAVTYKDKMYGLPLLKEVQTYFYNTKILKKLGGDPKHLPQTWDEFNALAEKAVKKGYYARNYEGGNTPNATLYPYVWQAGGQVITDDGKIAINKSDAVKGFELVNNWYKNKMIPKDSINTIDHLPLFLEGKSLAYWGTGASLATMKEKGFKDYAIGSPLKNKEIATFGTTGMFVVSGNSENKKLAAQLVKSMTSTESLKAFNKLTKYVPPRKSAASIYNEDKDMKILTEYAKYAKPGVIHPVSRSVMPQIQAKLQEMMQGKKTPQQAADSAAKAIQEEMNK
ncbi:sugar ABC transporter substrate-binding protein [Fictibacillus enclensis]|uniref:sugar ABC transporter substrate-binding protein n=1 Tax=Fictibacillus enclensis TaxID=1017270 RepID=UPI0025A2D448|nr:sugar ABC transporter substrate-binding protein [Fictibacillus enclensis]MDM5201260.1 sugar ABC transporter substrate-binding protein [Fictibacillus enclensis]